MENIKKILFVCTGNSCRSVMAEYYCRKRIEELNIKGVEVASAGVSAPAGLTASAETQIVLGGDDIIASEHRAHLLNSEDIMTADIILAMETFHQEHITMSVEKAESKTYLLKNFGIVSVEKGKNMNIADPIGRSMAFYQDCYHEIKKCVNRALSIITNRIAIGADHGGVMMKDSVKETIAASGYTVEDFGTDSTESCDYPLIASSVAEAVSQGKCQKGILICKSGVGMTIVANKFPGVRAAVCDTALIAELSREHNDCNILVFGSERLQKDSMQKIFDAWISSYCSEERHQRRVKQIETIENENFSQERIKKSECNN